MENNKSKQPLNLYICNSSFKDTKRITEENQTQINNKISRVCLDTAYIAEIENLLLKVR